jgi:S1-C subfamily serine protease
MISRSTFVRRADGDVWIRAGKIKELFGEDAESSAPRDPRARSRQASSSRIASAKPSASHSAPQPKPRQADEPPGSASLPPRPKPVRPKVEREAISASAALPSAGNEEEFIEAVEEVVEYEAPVDAVETIDNEPEAYDTEEQAAAPSFPQPAAPRPSHHAPRRGKSSSSNQSKVIILSSVAVVGCLLLFVGVFFLAKNLAGGSSSSVALGGNSAGPNSADKNNNDEPPAPAIAPGEFEIPGQNTSNSPTEHLSLPDFIERYEKAAVQVDVITADGAGNGSGFVVDPSGIVVTNHHVIEKARTAKVKFNSSHNYMKIDVEGILFFDRSIDVAILKLKTSKTLPTLELAKQPPRPGEEVVAFGAPQGLSFTATRGEVSAVRPAEELGGPFKGYWVQTTAEITFGNSGGPLVSTSSHKVVGINTFMSGDRAIRFASSSVNIIEALKSVDKKHMVALGSAEIAGIMKWPKD